MILKITGLTDSVITLNVLGVTLHGQVSGIFNVQNDNQLTEIKMLRKVGLIKVEDMDITQTEQELPPEKTEDRPTQEEGKEEGKEEPKVEVKEEPKEEPKEEVKENPKKVKKSPGRPKGSKNKAQKKTLTQDQKVKKAEAETDKMGSDVVVATGEGFQKVKMRHSFAGEIPESEKTQASLDAIDKILKEENDEPVEDKPTIDESKLDPSEQMGRNAVVSDMGKPTQTEMKNSILPHAKETKERDPFIDREEKEDDKSKNAFLDKPDDKDDPDDSFIEV